MAELGAFMDPAILAARYLELAEVPGRDSNHLIQGMIEIVLSEMRRQGLEHLPNTPADDATPWCSAFGGYIAFNCGLERPSRHADPEIRKLALRARAWLKVGELVLPEDIQRGEALIFNRADGPADVTVINAPGHFAWSMGEVAHGILPVVGGNQGNKVSIATLPSGRLLGARRLSVLG